MLLQISTLLLGLVSLELLFLGLWQGVQKTPFPPSVKKRNYVLTWAVVHAWVIGFLLISKSGFFNDFSSFPPKLLIVPMFPLVVVIGVSYVPFFRKTLLHIPFSWLAGLQFFRVLVELILWQLFEESSLPVQMTFEGRNFDILVGLTAPLAAWYFVRFPRNRKAILTWNIFGLALLVNIVGIAILSMPSPIRQFFNEPANTIVATYPYILIPGLYVPIAYTLHIASLRKWWLERKQHF